MRSTENGAQAPDQEAREIRKHAGKAVAVAVGVLAAGSAFFAISPAHAEQVCSDPGIDECEPGPAESTEPMTLHTKPETTTTTHEETTTTTTTPETTTTTVPSTTPETTPETVPPTVPPTTPETTLPAVPTTPEMAPPTTDVPVQTAPPEVNVPIKTS